MEVRHGRHDLVLTEHREGLASIHEEAGDVVQILTVHKAKGMQWPIVVVPDLDRGSGQSGVELLTSPETGPIPRVETADGARVYGAVASVLRDDARRRSEAEDRRLLYVALTRAEDHLILSSSCELADDSSLSGPGQWLGWIAGALELDPMPADGAALGEGRGWRGVVRRPDPAPSPWRGVAAPDREDPALITAALDARPARLRGHEKALAAAIAPPEPGVRQTPRYTATALADWLSCPMRYCLRYVHDLPERAPRRDWLHTISAAERGTLVHQIMESIGRDGEDALDRAVELVSFPRAISHRLDEDQRRLLRDSVLWFLGEPMYRDWIAGAARLRAEAPFAVVLEGAIIEGKIDALAEGADGALRLLDYKTGAPDEGLAAQHRFQIGLYCAAVRAATGVIPEQAALVYLTDRRCEPIEPAAAAAEALTRAREAIDGIASRRFPRGDCPGPERCGLAYACKLA